MTDRYIRFLAHDETYRPYKPPLPLADPVAAYAPFAYETRGEALAACATDLSRRWAEVAAGKRCSESAGLDHYVVLCRILPDGRIVGGKLEFAFPPYTEAGDTLATNWDVSLDRAEVERRTATVGPDGWVWHFWSDDD